MDLHTTAASATTNRQVNYGTRTNLTIPRPELGLLSTRITTYHLSRPMQLPYIIPPRVFLFGTAAYCRFSTEGDYSLECVLGTENSHIVDCCSMRYSGRIPHHQILPTPKSSTHPRSPHSERHNRSRCPGRDRQFCPVERGISSAE